MSVKYSGRRNQQQKKVKAMALTILYKGTMDAIPVLDKAGFTKSNAISGNTSLEAVYGNVAYAPVGVLGGTVAALVDGSNYTVTAATGANAPVGLFVNDAAGAPFENSPAVASGKVTVINNNAKVEVDVFANDIYEASVGDPLYSDANGLLTTTKGTDETIIGIITKVPAAAGETLGLDMRI